MSQDKVPMVNAETIAKLNPCKNRFDNYLEHYKYFQGSLEEFTKLDKITYSDKIWVIVRLFTKEQNVGWSIKCAESVLHIFESKYPEDKRPRLAIEAAKNYLLNPSAAAHAAYDAAYDAARAAAHAAAHGAAHGAAHAAARAAAYAAARAAAYAAAYAARAAAERHQEELNLKFAVEVVNEPR